MGVLEFLGSCTMWTLLDMVRGLSALRVTLLVKLGGGGWV